MLHLVDGTWEPNAADRAAGLQPGLGATTMALNGAIGDKALGSVSSQCNSQSVVQVLAMPMQALTGKSNIKNLLHTSRYTMYI